MRPPASEDVCGGASPLVIELCGLPGAGKTTVAHALVAQLREQGCPAHVVDDDVSAAVPRTRRVQRKLKLLASVLAIDPLGEARAARLLGRGQRSRRDMLAVPVQWWVAERLLSDARCRTGVSIVEEGLVQALWSAGLRSGATTVPDLVALAESAVRPDLVVHLDVPVELALSRLRSRGSRHSRVQRLTPGAQLATMREGDLLLRGLLAEWTRRGFGEVTVARVPASGPYAVDSGARDLDVVHQEAHRTGGGGAADDVEVQGRAG
ncbi:MAG TPA: AAA family ATPase [Nocardioidaceae bacterium]|nr:AAA family ATPase [Nocardioidaceae bacterium]